MIFNASMNQANINLNIHCISTQEELQSLAIEESLDLAFDFEDPSALLPGSSKSVAYHIRPSYNKFTITNWANYANTTHQAPNAVATSLAYLFVPLQHFMDTLISFSKNASIFSYQPLYRQFPSLSYYQDTRVSVLELTVSSIFLVSLWNSSSLFVLGDRLLHDLRCHTSFRGARKANAGSPVHDRSQRVCVVHFLVLHIPAPHLYREYRRNGDLLALHLPEDSVVHRFHLFARVCLRE